MDYDTYSANDAIGKVYISLHPLLLSPALVVDNYVVPISHSGKGIYVNSIVWQDFIFV